jgi:hypothetical protein
MGDHRGKYSLSTDGLNPLQPRPKGGMSAVGIHYLANPFNVDVDLARACSAAGNPALTLDSTSANLSAHLPLLHVLQKSQAHGQSLKPYAVRSSVRPNSCRIRRPMPDLKRRHATGGHRPTPRRSVDGVGALRYGASASTITADPSSSTTITCSPSAKNLLSPGCFSRKSR